MKAILINANERKVVAVDVKPDPNRSLDGLRALIGCEWVQPVVISETLTLWLDEEGRLKLPKPGFRLQDIPADFAGNGALLGGDADRVWPCRVPAEIVAMGIEWLAPGEVTPSAPPQFIVCHNNQTKEKNSHE